MHVALMLLLQVLFFPAMKPEDQDKSSAQKTAHPATNEAAKLVRAIPRIRYDRFTRPAVQVHIFCRASPEPEYSS